MEINDLRPGQTPEDRSVFDTRDLIGCIVACLIPGLLMYLGWRYMNGSKHQDNFYGYGVFYFLPFLSGAISGFISNWYETTERATTWISALLINIFAAVGLMAAGIEGAVCIVMAIPITYPFIALGGFIARGLMNFFRSKPRILVSVVPVLVVMGTGSLLYSPGFVNKVESTTMDIDASPEKIWPYLFELKALPDPDQWIFKTGIAYTLGTSSGGKSVGSSRQCHLTTGVMNETITELLPNQYMRFDVLNTPPSMKETNPFHDIHPRHETGCFKVSWGEFKLERLPGSRTRFTGTSCYAYNIYPAFYWGLYTDTIAEQIHVRMMGEIKRRVEIH